MIIASLDLPRCLEVADLLSEFLDGELDDAMRHRVALHLAMCEACAELAATVAPSSPPPFTPFTGSVIPSPAEPRGTVDVRPCQTGADGSASADRVVRLPGPANSSRVDSLHRGWGPVRAQWEGRCVPR